MNPEIKELYDDFRIEIIENMLSEMKEIRLFIDVQCPEKQIELEQYLDERKGNEVLVNV
jgi:hypothetical protein